MSQYIMALDAGTTSARAIIFNLNGQSISVARQEITQFYPQPGWVEHDAEEILAAQITAARKAIRQAGIKAAQIAGIGITNQRETVIIWDRKTGKPVCPAIVWQCRRTAERCEQLKNDGAESLIRAKTGLVIDAYFSGSKLQWLLDHTPGLRQRAENGELACGTVESYLIWQLSAGKNHVTDYANASRTMLFNIHTLAWDNELLQLFNIPSAMLPTPCGNSQFYGVTRPELFGGAIALCGAAGDQQAALFGQCCFAPGMAKNTYGTGCFMLMNTGNTAVHSTQGLLTTIGWSVNGKINYALEGSVFSAGSAVQWLRDELQLIPDAAASCNAAGQVTDTNGCFIVPAFTGLGAPYWDSYARGMVVGLTRGVNRNHLIRAVLESIAYQVYDVLEAMKLDSGLPLKILQVDGGACANDFLLQMQADVLNTPVARPCSVERTAAGAAYLAGIAAGVWSQPQELELQNPNEKIFRPQMPLEKRYELLNAWHHAVKCARFFGHNH